MTLLSNMLKQLQTSLLMSVCRSTHPSLMYHQSASMRGISEVCPIFIFKQDNALYIWTDARETIDLDIDGGVDRSLLHERRQQFYSILSNSLGYLGKMA